MIVSDMGQAKVFVINIAFGMLCVMIYDLFYVIKQSGGKGSKILHLLDVIYFLVIFSVMLYAQVKFNLGALRYYQIIALLGGMILEKLLLSEIMRKVFKKSSVILNKILKVIITIIYKPIAFILRCFFTVVGFFEEKIIKFFHKTGVKAKKVGIKRKKIKNTAKKRMKMI